VPEHEFNGHASVPAPSHFGGGERITQRPASAPPANHAVVAGNAGFARGIQAQQRVEIAPNHYYWHTAGGVRYAHYYHDGIHWYGFYHGPNFYWSRYYGNRWWWFDVSFGGRWCYWWNGFWWWPGPAGVMYVYVDNGYYPYDAAGVTVVKDEYHEAPAAPPAAGAGSSSMSPDGKRMVQIVGGDGEAYLYDKTGPDPVYLKFMARGVQKAKFSGGTGGAPLEILLEFKDDSFALFDAEGQPLDPKKVAAPAQAAPPPSTPESAPPPPPGATQ
jgi:hypothetical protein